MWVEAQDKFHPLYALMQTKIKHVRTASLTRFDPPLDVDIQATKKKGFAKKYKFPRHLPGYLTKEHS